MPSHTPTTTMTQDATDLAARLAQIGLTKTASHLDDFLAREGAGVSAYVDELGERSPFRRQSGG